MTGQPGTQGTGNTVRVSLFQLLISELGSIVTPIAASKATLVDLSHTIEDCILREKLPSVIFTGFQESSYWREETERYLELAGIAHQICIFAGGEPPMPEEKHIAVTLTGDDPLRQEWFLLVLSDHFSVVLTGLDNLAPVANEVDRSFQTMLSFHPIVVRRAVQAILPAVQHYRPDRAAELAQAVADFPPRHPDGGYVTMMMSRITEHLQRRYDVRREQVNELERLQVALRRVVVQLAVPVVPMFKGVIVVPIVGFLDTDRAQQVVESLLEGISKYQADIAIVDVTGLNTLDTHIANYLMQATQAANLLGARIILTGISGPTAQAMTHLGINLHNVVTSSNLQSAVQIALQMRGLQLAPIPKTKYLSQ
ncbi:MAG: anti-anti-sigma factor [Chloroflexaceae bacterium]|nr:anti-anti-sigma factor [Chloroflexaceae bacterium]NJL32789.1 anti-anti-sigma factor [Chloroflexaceae bacterium]NJO06572.1 anti-anti-sigma factor [Chloroflexaceae bacterium]